MKYKTEDIKQAAVGSIAATIFFFALRAGSPGPFINQNFGMIIFLIWAYLLYGPFKKSGKSFNEFGLNIIVSAFICGILAIYFGTATFEQVVGLSFFGGPAGIATMMAMPMAMLFDLKNTTSVLSKYKVWHNGPRRR